jgi:hypothetical protein
MSFNKRWIKPTTNESVANKLLENKFMDNIKDNRICPHCNCGFLWNGNFCRVCGAFPVNPIIRDDELF